MSSFELILRVVALVLLAAYLLYKDRQRMRSWFPSQDSAKWNGSSIDSTSLLSRMKRVRSDYNVARPSSLHSSHRQQVLEFARSAIRRINYFRKRTIESEVQDRSGA
jgi:hypothetical protein